MTREEAIKKHRELWHWVADETRRRKDCDVQKEENPDVAKEGPMNSCWLCEYVRQFGNRCEECPIDWWSETCLTDGSPYNEWLFGFFSIMRNGRSLPTESRNFQRRGKNEIRK